MNHIAREKSTNILFVDDDPGIQRMFKRILGRSGYTVHVADGGEEAFARLKGCLPDLIMLDLSMPSIDGFEVAGHLKRNPQTRDIPIILITGLDTSDNHVKAMDLGVNDFLSKTAEPE